MLSSTRPSCRHHHQQRRSASTAASSATSDAPNARAYASAAEIVKSLHGSPTNISVRPSRVIRTQHASFLMGWGRLVLENFMRRMFKNRCNMPAWKLQLSMFSRDRKYLSKLDRSYQKWRSSLHASFSGGAVAVVILRLSLETAKSFVTRQYRGLTAAVVLLFRARGPKDTGTGLSGLVNLGRAVTISAQTMHVTGRATTTFTGASGITRRRVPLQLQDTMPRPSCLVELLQRTISSVHLTTPGLTASSQ
mmetsp:Transcript_26767/g.45455  ORF Transcript_26767/g.45455 Transcript_26767/m.45455 type:complete len:250 (-) Transcript_26767:249-998(-)